MTTEDLYFFLCERAQVMPYPPGKARSNDSYWHEARAIERFVDKRTRQAA